MDSLLILIKTHYTPPDDTKSERYTTIIYCLIYCCFLISLIQGAGGTVTGSACVFQLCSIQVKASCPVFHSSLYCIPRPVPDYKFFMALEFFNKLKNNELVKEEKRNRGPFLALLKLLKQMQDNCMEDLSKGGSDLKYFKLKFLTWNWSLFTHCLAEVSSQVFFN